MFRKVKFRILHATSQDDQYPARELNHTSPSTKGWRSAKNCPYPQQIVVELEKRSRIRKIQILSHQYLIGMFMHIYIYIYLSTISQLLRSSFLLGTHVVRIRLTWIHLDFKDLGRIR